MKPLLIYGNAVFSEVVSELALLLGYKIAAYIDDFDNSREGVYSSRQALKDFTPDVVEVAVAIGYRNLTQRMKIVDRLLDSGYSMPNLVHPAAYVARTATLGSGNIIMANAVIDSFVRIENACVLWPTTCINHHSILKSNSFFSPASIVCGSSVVGESTFLGASSTVLDGSSVPPNSFVKMGSCFVGEKRE